MLEPARAAVLRLGALAGLARAHVHGDVDVLAHPEGEAPHQRPRLGSPEVPSGPSWHSRSTCAEHLRAGPSWHSRSTYALSPPPAGMMQSLSASPCRGARPQRTRNVPPRGVFVRFNEEPVDERTQGRHRACTIGPKSRLGAPSTVPGRTTVRERGRPRTPVATGQPLCRSLLLSGSSAPASAMNIPAPGGICSPPGGGGSVWGIVSLLAVANATAAARRLVTHRAQTAASIRRGGSVAPRRV